jgi:hypothetical protein
MYCFNANIHRLDNYIKELVFFGRQFEKGLRG